MNAQSQVEALPTILAATRDSPRAYRAGVLDRRGVWAGRLIGVVIGAVGAMLSAGGLWLILVGGSPYYLMSGIGYVVVGVLLSRRRPAGASLAAALLARRSPGPFGSRPRLLGAFPRVLCPAASHSSRCLPLYVSRRTPAARDASVAAALALALAVDFAFASCLTARCKHPPARL